MFKLSRRNYEPVWIEFNLKNESTWPKFDVEVVTNIGGCHTGLEGEWIRYGQMFFKSIKEGEEKNVTKLITHWCELPEFKGE